MSGDKPSKGKGAPKPFLGDDELSLELDAWDEMFDNLHDTPAPAAAPASAPAPSPDSGFGALDAGHTLDDMAPFAAGGEGTLDEQLTLDAPVPTSAPARNVTVTPEADDPWGSPDEADFSGVSDEPAPATSSTRLDVKASRPATNSDDDDDALYTSASRPNVKSPPSATPLPDDPIAPPPKPAAVKRTGPAIIRRQTPLAVPVVPAAPDASAKKTPQQGYPVQDFGGDSDFGGSTRVADFGDMDALAQGSRRDDARSKAPTAPPPMSFTPDYGGGQAADDEDDYEIEIGASDAPAPVAQPRRTVANVIRRDPAKAPAAPAPVRRESEPIIEVSREEAPAGGEDDFSDVAAEVISEERHGRMTALQAAQPAPEDSFEDVAASVGADPFDDMPLETPSQVARRVPNLDAVVPDVADPFAEPEEPVDQVGFGTDADRPPALMDLYPRVKRPTSVPVSEPPRAVQPVATEAEQPEVEPVLDLEAIGADSVWPEQVPPLQSAALDREASELLPIYEREIETVDEPAMAAALRIEAGRLCERIGDADRARAHYDAALLADPRATAALRGLRRIARRHGDLVEATRQIDAEIAVAGALERRPLGNYRVDLLMASGEHDLARVAVGDILDTAPSDVRSLLAQLELAYLDARTDDFGRSLERLAHAVTDPQLRAAVQQARGALAAQQNDGEGAARWFAEASEGDGGSLGARLAAVREAASKGKAAEVATALLELAQIVATADLATGAALALRAQHWATGDHAKAAAAFAAATLPSEPLVARAAAEAALAGGDTAADTQALTSWAASSAPDAERAYAASRAAELDASTGGDLWSQALEIDPGDDYAAANLRTAHVAAEQMADAISIDRRVSMDPDRDRARLRAAFGMIAQGELDAATALLAQGRAARPTSVALAEALAEALAAAGRWSERARVISSLAASPGEQLDRDVAALRSAYAWEEAVGAAGSAENPDPDELDRSTAAALGAWEKVIEQANGAAPEAHAAAIVLGTRLGDREVLGDILGRAQAAERSPWAAASLGLRRARLVGTDDPTRAESILAESGGGIDDPRRIVAQLLSAARRNELADAVTLLEERAAQLGDTREATTLRLRAAQLALDANDAVRATGLLRKVAAALPGVSTIDDLLSVARRRAGETSGPTRVVQEGAAPTTPDEFARVVRDADEAAARGDGATALTLYQNALAMRPGDPLVEVPLVRTAIELRDAAPVAALALAQLRDAEASGDAAAKADAYELLSRIDRDLRGDAEAAQVALESAAQADPSRIDILHRLGRESAAIGEQLRLRQAELAQIAPEHAADRAAVVMDTATLAQRDARSDAELADLYRDALRADPRHRIALLHLESIVRRGGASEELAKLEEQIAAFFEGDARAQAAFLTRAGETLVELGQIDAAVAMFGRADAALPGHVPALEGWRAAALKGQLWLDVAEAATRQASVGGDPAARARLHHFAGVALMDKALIGEQAMLAFRRALEADPSHRDAFLRLRILLEEEGDHDQLAILISNRIDHEPPGPHKLALHRALAELSRNFLDDRETAKKHFRAILESDPNDLRAHAAITDIAWEQGSWQEAADALVDRARLEHDPEVLKRLCYRLGLIYADRLVDPPMALKAFQRALQYDPDDVQTLERLADLAIQAGEWKLALGACERLVKNEEDPDRRAGHLHRVARIFRQGFGDQKRAERALNLALDNAPTNDEALTELVRFYRDANDMTSVRVHLNRVAGTMRTRLQSNPRDGVAYRVISRAMSARSAVGVDGSSAVARAAAELAQLLGEAGEPERMLLGEPSRSMLAPLLRPEADDVLYPRGVQTELRQIFTLLGDRVAKHVGVDLRALYGVARGDRLKPRESAVATHAQDVATGLGFGEIDVYISSRQPYAMVAEPTSPVSLVIGQAIAGLDSRSIRFAAGSALKLAQAHLAIPARLAPDELGVLVVALLRQFQDRFPAQGLDENAIATQLQKLKRLIPTGLANELRPFAFAVDAGAFSPGELSRDLRIAGARAGVVAGGSLVAALAVLAGQAGTDIQSFLADPVAQGLVMFALGEDHATLAR